MSNAELNTEIARMCEGCANHYNNGECSILYISRQGQEARVEMGICKDAVVFSIPEEGNLNHYPYANRAVSKKTGDSWSMKIYPVDR